MKRPKKDIATVKKEVELYASMGGKSYRVKNAEHVIHFLHLGQLEEYFKKSNSMPLLENTKWDLFLINSSYDIYNQETGEQRDSSPEEALDIYILEYLSSGFIEESGLLSPEDF